MATSKKTTNAKDKKSRVQVRDLKPKKDAKGGTTRDTGRTSWDLATNKKV